jgi:hypothetical protein
MRFCRFTRKGGRESELMEGDCAEQVNLVMSRDS